jgi:hypothetical protein
MASPHRTAGSRHYLAHDDVPEGTDGDNISIHTTEEMEKYESLHRRELLTLVRWILLLLEFDLEIREKKGVQNLVT